MTPFPIFIKLQQIETTEQNLDNKKEGEKPVILTTHQYLEQLPVAGTERETYYAW